MPPQTPNFQKNVQTPNVAQGRALNLSQEAKAASDMAADFGKTISNGVGRLSNAIMQYKADKQNAEDLLKSNNIYNEYVKELGKLNTKMSLSKGADAVNFRGKYNTDADSLSEHAVETAKSEIKNTKVRDDLFAKINSINLRNREESFAYFEKEQRDLQRRANNETIDNIANQAVSTFVNDDGATNNIKLDNLFGQIEPLIQANMESEGFKPVPDDAPGAANINKGISVMYRNQVMQKRQEILSAIGDHLNATNTGNTKPWQETASAIALMEYARDHGYVEEGWANKKLKEYEEKALGVELIRNKDKYWNPTTGEYNYNLVAKNVKYLSQDEIIRANKIVADASANNPMAGSELGSIVVGLNNAAIEDDKLWRREHGFLADEEVKDFTQGMSDDEKKEWNNTFLAARKKTSPSEIIEHFVAMKNMQTKPVIYVPELNRAVRITADNKVSDGGLTEEQRKMIEKNLAEGKYPKYYPWNQNSEYNKAVLQYQKMADAALLQKALDGQKKVVRRNGGWLFGDYKYRTQDMIYQNLWNAFSAEAKRSAKEGDLLQMIDTNSLVQAANNALDKARNGGWVNADPSYANAVKMDDNGNPILDENGNKQYIRVFKPVDISISGDGLSKTQKADIAAITIEALRSTVAADRFGWLENTPLMKEAKAAAQQDKIGMVKGTGNVFVDDNETFVQGGYEPAGVLTRLGAREAYKAQHGIIIGNKL